MRLWVLLGTGVLAACGGTSEGAGDAPNRVTPGGAGSGATDPPAGHTAAGGGTEPTAGNPTGGTTAAVAGSSAGGSAGFTGGGSAAHPGGTAGAAGSAGAANAGSASAGGEGGGSGGAGGDGRAGDESTDGGAGGSSPIDDTGCIERPWSGNLGDLSEKVSGLDCSSCSNGAELGYATPTFCAAARACAGTVDPTQFGADDVLLLLPPGSAQASACVEQACADGDGDPAPLPGFVMQLLLLVPQSQNAWKIETDPARRVLRRDVPLLACDEASSCYAQGDGAAQLAIVVPPGAPRGWLRVTLGSQATACE